MESLDGSLFVVSALVEVSIDGRLVVGFDTEEDSMECELVVVLEGRKNCVERLSVVSSIIVED